MADKQTAAPSAPKMVTCKVVSNYGAHRPGETIEVSEREYNRLRTRDLDDDGKPAGDWKFPVLINATDAAAIAKREEAEREAKQRQMREATDGGAGWADYERESLDIVQRAAARRAHAQQEEIAAKAAEAR